MEDDKSSNPFNAVSYKNIRDKIKEGIKSLPEKQRLVLSLYYYEDLNLKEIGSVLDVTESRVSQLHTQAIMKLKAKLRNIFESPEDLAS
jgi:RNA polymerase sigma factor for flagellar operon FliA